MERLGSCDLVQDDNLNQGKKGEQSPHNKRDFFFLVRVFLGWCPWQ
jgi:hypothetical protein